MLAETATKVLIVDDLPENLQALAKVIENEDRVIYQAQSGEAALGLLLEHEFALAILDVMMPGMNGFELAELMRSTERTRDIPIVFVTAAGRELDYAFKGYESGAVDFLYKPLDVVAVRSKVNVFVSLFQQRQETERQVAALREAQQELHSAQLDLQRALEMRDEFISMVAHELRTPLNTLHLEAQVRQMMLKEGRLESFTPDGLAAMVSRDARQIDSMTRLIADMVDVTRIQSGKVSVEIGPFNLTDLLARVVDDLSLQAEAAGCDIQLHNLERITAKGDELRVEQIVVNLLTNALRYGAGKPIYVALESHSGKAEVSVRDHGAGIPKHDQQRIFEKFERVGSTHGREGLGMGLYIARQLAEAQSGTLTVTSEPGNGATFKLGIPVASAHAEKIGGDGKSARAATSAIVTPQRRSSSCGS